MISLDRRRADMVVVVVALLSNCCLLTGEVTLPEKVEMVLPGDNITANFELIMPIAIQEGLRFAVREGGKTIGAGVVTKLID